MKSAEGNLLIEAGTECPGTWPTCPGHVSLPRVVGGERQTSIFPNVRLYYPGFPAMILSNSCLEGV